jgi:hypothetical protein
MASLAVCIYYTSQVQLVHEEIIGHLSKRVNNHFERSRVKNNEIYFMGPKITSKDREFSRELREIEKSRD